MKISFILLILVLSYQCCTACITKVQPSKDLNNLPVILWWQKQIFPHAEEPERDDGLVEVNCPNLGYKCMATYNKNILEQKSTELLTIMQYGTDFRAYEAPLPRKPNHLWALLHEESPQNNYLLCNKESLELFNFSATFKRNSDFPLTTQHFVSSEHLTSRKPISVMEKNKLRKQGLAPIVYLQSHCDVPSDRDRYVYHLMGNISIDSYGACLNNKDFPNADLVDTSQMNSEKLLDMLAKYKFHIAFENAICDDYITEKLTRPLHVGSIPIYRGSPSVRDWAPDHNSIIIADEFESPERLAEYIHYLDQNDEAYLKYLAYKDQPELPNKWLSETLNNRKWDLNGEDTNNFVGGYECYVCGEMHKMEAKLRKGIKISPRVVPHNHLDCSPPQPSIGDISDIPPNDHLHNWISDYWQNLDQAVALRDMVLEGVSDSESLWSYIERRYHAGEGAMQHNEL
nr:alpha-(1,3)-fucosyltransferase 11 [Ciona intestinalis]|eukprot:XP_002121131.3 alpha-(1,3)-fucosyltransferase 11 [Ciona intestinalis]